ncbi:MAG TPA: hypothetical protein GXZ37_02695 [Clostridiales bacterium]|nr:hypothetical protein [Clostridiales bacterium]
MRKLLSVFLCALMVLSVLAGCAGKQTSENTDAAPSTSATTKSTETAQPEPKENVELTFVSMEDAKLPYFENSQAVYVKKNPNVSFKKVNVPQANYIEKLTIMLAGGDTSDIFIARQMSHYLNMIMSGY